MKKTTKIILLVNIIGAILIAISIYSYDSFQWHFNKGVEAFEQKNYLLAENDFIRAVAIAKNFDELDHRISLSSYYLGKTYRMQGKNRQEAEESFIKALSISEKSTSNWTYVNELRQELALIYLEQGKYEDSEFLLQAALDKLKSALNDKIDISITQSKISSEILEKLTFSQDMKRLVALHGNTQHIEAVDILKSFAASNYNAGRYHLSNLFLNQAYDILHSLEKQN